MGEINLFNLVDLAFRRLWALILAFVITATGAYSYCKFIATPRYKSTASIIVTNGAIITDNGYGGSNSTTVSGTDVAASLTLVDTIIDILKTPDLYKKTAESFGPKYTYNELRSMASIERQGENTLFVNVSFSGSNPQDVATLATLFAETACKYIQVYIPNSNAKVMAKAVKSSLVYPRTLTTTAIAGLVGAAVIYGLFLLFETTNKTIKSEEDFNRKYDIAVLGLIPDFENIDAQSSNYHNYYKKGGYGSYGSYGK